jgi:hypothetical protein
MTFSEYSVPKEMSSKKTKKKSHYQNLSQNLMQSYIYIERKK